MKESGPSKQCVYIYNTRSSFLDRGTLLSWDCKPAPVIMCCYDAFLGASLQASCRFIVTSFFLSGFLLKTCQKKLIDTGPPDKHSVVKPFRFLSLSLYIYMLFRRQSKISLNGFENPSVDRPFQHFCSIGGFCDLQGSLKGVSTSTASKNGQFENLRFFST